MDAKANLLTVITCDGSEVSYNPALLRKQTDRCRIFRGEWREIAEGECLRFTASDQTHHIRAGQFATVERIGNENSLTVRHDNGKTVRLSESVAHYIEYGYTANRIPRSIDRVLVTGEALQLAQQQTAFSHVSSQTGDVAIYASNDGHAQEIAGRIVTSPEFSNLANPSPAEAAEEFGIGR